MVSKPSRSPASLRADALRLAEIDVAGEFAHDQDVQPDTTSGLQRRGVGQFRIDHAPGAGWRTGRVPCAGRGSPARGAWRARSVSYFGSPTEPNRIASASLRQRERRLRQRMARRVVARAADRRLLDLELQRRAAPARAAPSAPAATISGPMPSPGSTAIFTAPLMPSTATAVRRGACLRSVWILSAWRMRESDLVQAVQQAVLAECVDLEAEHLRAVRRRHGLLREVDDQPEAGERRHLVEQAVDFSGLGQHDRQEAVLEASC